LTSGLESLDKREQEYWKDRIKAGNLYINRGTTGAITLRQPFGGMGKSAIGAGIKAGGPKYVAQFMNFEETGPPLAGPVAEPHTLLRLAQHWQKKLDGDQFEEFGDDLKKTIRAIKSYIFHVEREFSRKIDYFHLRGQDNILRYLPVGKVIVRLHRDDSLFDILARIAAVKITGCELQISIPANLESTAAQFLSTPEGRRLIKNAPIHHEQDIGLIEHIPEVNRIRYAAPQRPSRKVLTAAAQTGFYIARTPVMMDGRIELLQYYQQQSICHTYHRYGNLGERALQYDSC
jgi:RHH-type proline utilization regulon transcriptional repressor/proline dehydrogenase/delta 1-pyrroline-5-carboxylate dehydrogenase